LLGEVYALICAFLWALSSTMVKSQAHKLDVVLLGALRTMPALFIYWGLLFFLGQIDDLGQLSLRSWGFLLGSTVVGLFVGDQLYFHSMKRIGLARALPLSTIYPFFTLILATLFLGEALGWPVVLGAVLIVAGAYLLAFPRGADRLDRTRGQQRVELGGVAMALVAALCWSGSTVMMRVGLEDVGVVLANAVRLSALAVMLLGMALRQRSLVQVKDCGMQTLGIVVLSGIVGTGLGSFTLLSAVKLAGAAKTSILTATAPLFAVPFSLILREKVSAWTLLGTVLTMLGVWLTI
jgi:drug/metabolite transporter (DMT)-like permease